MYYLLPTILRPDVLLLFLCYVLGDAGGTEDEKRMLLCQLQEKSSEVARLEKQVAELGSRGLSLQVEEGSSSEREQLQVRTQGKSAHIQEEVLNALKQTISSASR